MPSEHTLFSFLCTTVAVSLSGVMAPGPITAATLAAGARFRHAGAVIALGHAAVEVPLIFLLAAGAGGLLRSPAARSGIGLAGGAMLVLMGLQLLAALRTPIAQTEAPVQRHPFAIGIVLTAANPYFLVWWATVGLELATRAVAFGALVIVLFVLVHWLCDLVWLEVLSVAGFKGSEVFGKRAQTVVSAVCGIVLLGFGAKFLYDAGLGIMAGRAAASQIESPAQPMAERGLSRQSVYQRLPICLRRRQRARRSFSAVRRPTLSRPGPGRTVLPVAGAVS